MSFLISSSHLFFGLPSGRLNIGFHLYIFFLPFSLPAFVVNGQTSLIFVLLCDIYNQFWHIFLIMDTFHSDSKDMRICDYFPKPKGVREQTRCGNTVMNFLNPIIPDDWTACCELLINWFEMFPSEINPQGSSWKTVTFPFKSKPQTKSRQSATGLNTTATHTDVIDVAWIPLLWKY